MVSLHELGVVHRASEPRVRRTAVIDFLTQQPGHTDLLPGLTVADLERRFRRHGDFERWHEALNATPHFDSVTARFGDTVSITPAWSGDPASAEAELEGALRALHPWRKGPFQIGSHFIDTEWRSDWKWARLAPHLDLRGRDVLDVGCGNGYFGWRMLDAGASSVMGIDPTILFCMQHQMVQRFVEHPTHWVLPIGIDDLPRTPRFDAVLSMGVIYHRREPQDHIAHLVALTKPGGTTVVESIVAQPGFVPEGRYARMRNVWYVPAVADLVAWMEDCGLTRVRCVAEGVTTTEEQRTTPWMTFESLEAALDRDDPSRTTEGHPAPARAIVIGERPTGQAGSHSIA